METVTRSCLVLVLLGLLLWTSPASAAMINIGVDGTFTENGPGLIFDASGIGDTFTFTNTSDPGGFISQLTLTLGPGLSYDFGGGFFSTGGRGAPFAITSDGGTGASLVGGSLHFTNFDPGETVEVTVDVDGLLLQVIPGSRFALGTTVAAIFDGPDFLIHDVLLAGGYTSPNVLGPLATTSVGGTALVPEPASLAMLGATALVMMVGRRRRRDNVAVI